jgi:homoserine kinase type II
MAVYTDVTDEELARFLEDYDLGEPIAFKGIAEGVSNSNFLLETRRGRFILTVYEQRTETAALPFFTALMRHLAGRGVSCPAPISRRDGEAIGSLCGKPAAIVSYLDGLSVRRPTVAHCREAGGALARLHLAGGDFPLRRMNALGLEGFSAVVRAALPRSACFAPGLAEPVERELAVLAGRWPTDLPTGVVHADLFPDNVFFAGGRVTGLIDFYFACTDVLAYDVAICLNAWCFEPDLAYNVTKGRAFLGGYRAVRPLGAGEIAALPVLARGAAMRFFATRLYDWIAAREAPPGQLVRPHDPRAYWDRIRFHQSAAGPAAYGIDP